MYLELDWGGEKHDNVVEMSLCKAAMHSFTSLHSDKCVAKSSLSLWKHRSVLTQTDSLNNAVL